MGNVGSICHIAIIKGTVSKNNNYNLTYTLRKIFEVAVINFTFLVPHPAQELAPFLETGHANWFNRSLHSPGERYSVVPKQKYKHFIYINL